MKKVLLKRSRRNDFGSIFESIAAASYDLRQFHFIETDMESNYIYGI